MPIVLTSAGAVPKRSKRGSNITSSVTLKRAASEESGEEPPAKLSKHGRPIRRSAGKISHDPAFVSTVNAIEKSEDESSDEDIEGKYRRPKKKERSPTPPPLSPVMEIANATGLDDPVEQMLFPPTASTPNELALTFNVPAGHQGAFVVKIDLSSILAGTLGATVLSNGTPSVFTNPRAGDSTSKTSSRRKNHKAIKKHPAAGFLDLPGELRNIIYRLVFVDEKPFDFRTPNNFCHSAALLQTCRAVHDEGAQILYGENKFILARQTKPRANYWTPQWTEVGFKDIRLWATTIGSANLSQLRDLSVLLEDGMPSSRPQRSTPEERRFVHDENLIQALKLLGQSAQLKTFTLALNGRKAVSRNDVRFVDHLKIIQADELDFKEHPLAYRTHYGYRRLGVDPRLEEILKVKMKRKHKLYK